MPKIDIYHHSFAVGVVDKTILPRTDLQVMQLAAEDQTNLLCMTSGKAFVRPGFEHLGRTKDDGQGRLLPFIFGADDACILELTNGYLRAWVNDALVTRPAVSSEIADGAFTALTGWTNASTTGATASVSGGELVLTAPAKGSRAIVKQQVTTSTPNVEHALRIVVTRGPLMFRCGSTDGGDDYVSETELKTGTHSLAFVPTGSYWVQFDSSDTVQRKVDSIQVESSGIMSLPTVWSASDLSLLRPSQSADVVFVACRGKRQQRIERRGVRGEGRSWSVVDYRSDTGPLTVGRTSRARIKPSVTQGNGTLTADKPLFSPGHVGALFRLTHSGQKVVQKLAGESQFTDPIEITGINNTQATEAADQFDEREWSWEVTGTWVGTLKVFRSFDGPDFGYQEYRAEEGAATIDITANDSGTNTDDDDNAQVWYRIGFDEGDYTSGTAEITLTYKGGGGSGMCRITGYTSSTSVNMEVLSPFKGTKYTDDWQEGQWSALRGFPSAGALFEGRLWWAGADKFWGSVSDDFENFDEETEGDSGPISRIIATDGVNDTQWIMPLQRLVLGTEGTETTARSSSFDEPLTPTNTTLKDASTVGASPVSPARVDGRGLFVDRSGRGIYELAINLDSADYAASRLSELAKSWFAPGVVAMATQRQPDTRVWAVLADGKAICIVYDPAQKVTAFIPVETQGDLESLVAIPGATQDAVYAIVKRQIGGHDRRFVEKMALDDDAAPGVVCKTMDCFATFTNDVASTTISGLAHLIGEQVAVWADGAPISTTDARGLEAPRLFQVSGAGKITVPSPVATGVVGLPFEWRYKSGRLAYGAAGGTAMLQKKRLVEIGLILTDYARDGIRYGSSFVDDKMLPLPVMRDGQVGPSVVLGSVDDERDFVLNDGFSLDSRLHIKGQSLFPASLLGLFMTIETNG